MVVAARHDANVPRGDLVGIERQLPDELMLRRAPLIARHEQSDQERLGVGPRCRRRRVAGAAVGAVGGCSVMDETEAQGDSTQLCEAQTAKVAAERGGAVDCRQVGECKVLKPLHPKRHPLQRLKLLGARCLDLGFTQGHPAVVVDVVRFVRPCEGEQLRKERRLGRAARGEGRDRRALEHVRIEHDCMEEAPCRQLCEQIDDELKAALEVTQERVPLACGRRRRGRGPL